MTDLDTTPAPVPTLAPDAFRARLADHDALNASLREGNKAALFASLATIGVTTVVVSFDGYGDSGQIESVEAKAGDETVELPDTVVTISAAAWDEPGPVARDLPIPELIERLAYDYLGATHCGWENNDGAYGEFVFDVTAGTITLDHNDRYTAIESYTHTF